ncbi:MAG: peptidylprolyl isomerase [Clostridia bacterium]|nr:peptidylprolyl isomerase [Clostridia bacterium]
MKNGLVKLISLLAVLALALTGCSMVEVDPVMQAAENMEALEELNSKVIVSYDGGEITRGQLLGDYVYQYSYLSYMYSMYYGTSISESEATDIARSVAEGYVNTYAVLKQAEKMGITLTEEEIAECEELANTAYQEEYDSFYATAEGDTEEVKKLNTEYEMASVGSSYEYYYNQQAWDKLLTKVEDAIRVDSPEITEDEILTRLAEQAMEDEKAYAQDFAAFEESMMDENVVVTWRPSGYRTVKHILVKPETEVLDAYIASRNAISTANSAIATLNNERLDAKNGKEGARALEEIEADIEVKQAELDQLQANQKAEEANCIANVQAKLTEIYAKLDAGEDFEAVMAEYGEDPGMQIEPTMSAGYYVCAESPTWDFSFRNAAMDLEKVGDYSAEPVVSASGVHIIYYASDVEGGAVALDEIREEYTEIAQTAADNEFFNGKLTGWVAELNPVYHMENFFE